VKKNTRAILKSMDMRDRARSEQRDLVTEKLKAVKFEEKQESWYDPELRLMQLRDKRRQIERLEQELKAQRQ
jgi:hypothetical protein